MNLNHANRIKSFGGILIILLSIVVCKDSTFIDNVYSNATNITLLFENGIRKVNDQQNSFDAYKLASNEHTLSIHWSVSDSSTWPINILRAYFKDIPGIGETLFISKPYLTDSTSGQIGIYDKLNDYSSESTIADTIFAKFTGIPFNDTIKIFNGDSAIDIRKAKERVAFSFYFKWHANEIKGTVFSIKVTDTIITNVDCTGYKLNIM
jgi:hypothetical protein